MIYLGDLAQPDGVCCFCYDGDATRLIISHGGDRRPDRGIIGTIEGEPARLLAELIQALSSLCRHKDKQAGKLDELLGLALRGHR